MTTGDVIQMEQSTLMLTTHEFIAIPGACPTAFDHGAWDARTDRVFVAHTAADTVEVIDGRRRRHERTLSVHAEAAGVVAAGGLVAITNRGAASVSIVDAAALTGVGTFATHPRPNGVALARRWGVVVVACLGTDAEPPMLDRVAIETGARVSIPLPGRPRWCVVDAAEARVFCAIQSPSIVLVAGLEPFVEQARWSLPSDGAHGVDLDPAGGRLFVACDGGSLVALDQDTGRLLAQWPLPGAPDATFFNSATGRVHVAIGDPGLIVSLDPRSGAYATHRTEVGAKTTALAAPDRLYVFLPQRGGVLELRDQPAR